jgi:hypothetical protein
MKISNIRRGVAKALLDFSLDQPVTEILAWKSERQGRLIYIVCNGTEQINEKVKKEIVQLLESEGYDVTPESFANPDVMNNSTPNPDKERIYHNIRGRTLKVSDLSNLNSKNLKQQVLESNWVLKVSRHEDEYFSMLDVFPSFYHPSQSVPGAKDPTDSIRHPLSYLQKMHGQGLMDSYDRLRLGIVQLDRSIKYVDEWAIGTDPRFGTDEGIFEIVEEIKNRLLQNKPSSLP